MTETHTPPASLGERLADLQRAVEVGFTAIDGKLALFTERDKVADALHSSQQTTIDTLGKQVAQHARQIAWAYGFAAGCSAMTGFIVWALTHH